VHGHTPALTERGPHNADAVLDHRARRGRICLDACAANRNRVAAIQVAGERYRLAVCDLDAGLPLPIRSIARSRRDPPERLWSPLGGAERRSLAAGPDAQGGRCGDNCPYGQS